VTPDDLRQMLRDLPAAVLVVVALWAFMVLAIAVVPA
jgi:hypothetical protein